MREFDFPFLSRDEAVDWILQILLRARNGSWSVTGFDRVSGLVELKSTRGFLFMKSTKCVKLRFTGGASTASLVITEAERPSDRAVLEAVFKLIKIHGMRIKTLWCGSCGKEPRIDTTDLISNLLNCSILCR
jgi:hypothetical protein